jgi:hypothetical protein
MGLRHLGGTVAALLAGVAAVVGAATVGPVAVALVAGVVVSAAGTYLFGDRRFAVPVGVALYLGTGAAVLGGVVAAPTVAAGPLVGVGVILAAGFSIRSRLGNARRVATLPVDPSGIRRREAACARGVLRVTSGVERVGDVGVGSVRVGAVVLALSWVGVVIGSAVAWATLPVPGGLGAELALVSALVVPFYRATDWRGIDAPDGPSPASTLERLGAVAGKFRRETPTETQALELATEAEPDPTADPETPDPPASDPNEGTPGNRTGTDPAGESTTTVDDDVEELPTAEEIGPASWETGSEDDEDATDPTEPIEALPSDEGETVTGGRDDSTAPPGTGDAGPEDEESSRSGRPTGSADPDGAAEVAGEVAPDGAGAIDGSRERESGDGRSPSESVAMPSVPDVGSSDEVDPGETDFEFGFDDGETEDDGTGGGTGEVMEILEARGDPEPIDPEASPAREAFGIHDRVSEILGDGDEDGPSESEGDARTHGEKRSEGEDPAPNGG